MTELPRMQEARPLEDTPELTAAPRPDPEAERISRETDKSISH